MPDAQITDLARFRADHTGFDATVPTPTSGAEEVRITWEGRLVAFDQTVSKTGWIVLDSTCGEITVEATGMVLTHPHAPPLKGNEDTLTRGAESFAIFCSLLSDQAPDRVVHEAPGVGKGLRRTESSLVASAALRCACMGLARPVTMIHAQGLKNWATGNKGADKPMVKQAVLRLLPAIAHHKPLNEHVYDAALVGLGLIDRGPK